MAQYATPPSYDEAPVPQPTLSGQNPPQVYGYNQGQFPQVVQGYPVVQPTPLTNPGCTQMFYTCTTVAAPTDYGKYGSRKSIVLGACQITIGILCIIFNSVLIGISGIWSLGFVAHGIWGGVLFIVTGGLGVIGGKWKAKCAIIAYMILCIISAIIAGVILIIAIIGLAIGSGEYESRRYYSYYNYYSYYTVRPDNYAAAMAMNILMVILSAIVGCMSIAGSTLCCRVGCCNGSQTTYVAAPVQFQAMGGNQQILLVSQPAPAPQFIPNPGYPMQMAVQEPAYQPSAQLVAGQTNQGFAEEFPQKNSALFGEA